MVTSSGSTSRTDLPISLASRISARTPTDLSQPGSIKTHSSSHRARNALSYRCQNAQSVGRPNRAMGCECAMGEKTSRRWRMSVAAARQTASKRACSTAGSASLYGEAR